MARVEVRVIEVDGVPRAVAIPDEDAKVGDWRLAYDEVRRLRKEMVRKEGNRKGRRASYTSLARMMVRQGWSWSKTASVTNGVYEVLLCRLPPGFAVYFLTTMGMKHPRDIVKTDLEAIRHDGELAEYPFNAENIRSRLRPIIEGWRKTGKS